MKDFWWNYGDTIKSAMFYCAVIIALLSIVVGCTMGISKAECNQLSKMNPSREFQWGFWVGCMIKTDSGLWIDAGDVYKVLTDKDQ